MVGRYRYLQKISRTKLELYKSQGQKSNLDQISGPKVYSTVENSN